MQGVITILQIPASGFPKPQQGTQESPAPGKQEQTGSSPMSDGTFRKHAGFVVGVLAWFFDRDGSGVCLWFFVFFF